VVEMTEQVLIARAQRGDQAAFETLWQQHKRQVRATTGRCLRWSNEAEDVEQQVFEKAFASIGKFEARSRFSTWLHPITVRKCLDHLKSKHARHLASLEPYEEESDVRGRQEVGGETARSNAQCQAFSEYLANLRAQAYAELALSVAEYIIQMMPELKAEVIRLAIWENYRAAVVAQLCGVEVTWVYDVVKEFRKKCRQALEDHSISERQLPAVGKLK
jgi:RNA polymerase sigma factor (sigma-70 family)